MPGGITFNNATWKYEFNGQPYDTYDAALAAQLSGQPSVGYTLPTGQTLRGPATISTPGLIGGGGGGDPYASGSMQSLAGAGGMINDALNFTRSQQAADADRAFKASQAGLDRSSSAEQAALDRAQKMSLTEYGGSQAALDRAQQTSLANLQAQTQKELQAQEEGFESAAAKDAYQRTAEQAALDRAFQTSTTATGVQTSRETQDRMMQFIMPFLSSFMGTGGTGTGAGSTSGTSDGSSGTAGGTVTPPVDDDALAKSAQSAAFARAKDQTSDLARSSLMTLRSAAAERGVNVAGGTNPALLSEESRTLQAAQKPLSDLTRQQAIDTSDRAQAVSDRDYAGNIALQGQKASLAPSLISLLKVGGLY